MLDDIDKKIIKVLEDDARTSLRKISELVDVSLGTVSNRVKRMEKNGKEPEKNDILEFPET